MISCSEYDYIEIVCIYRYPVRLTLKSGEIIEAVALDTQRNSSRQECIKVGREDEDSMLIVLDSIVKMEVCVENPHFKEITFSSH